MADSRLHRLLIVPDDLLVLDLRASFLDRRGVATRSAIHAEEAVAIAMVWAPDLIVLGDVIPGMESRAFVEHLREQVERHDSKLVLLTTTIGEAFDAELASLVDAHLVAPIDSNQLLDTAASLLEIRQRRAPRAPAQLVIRLEGLCEKATEHPVTVANTLDVSAYGLRVEPKHALAVGREGIVNLVLPNSAERLSIRCAVRLVVDELQMHYGLEFLQVSAEHLEIIGRFVAEELGE